MFDFDDLPSPRFGEMSCLGAIVMWLFIILAVGLLLYLPWSMVLREQ